MEKQKVDIENTPVATPEDLERHIFIPDSDTIIEGFDRCETCGTLRCNVIGAHPDLNRKRNELIFVVGVIELRLRKIRKPDIDTDYAWLTLSSKQMQCINSILRIEEAITTRRNPYISQEPESILKDLPGDKDIWNEKIQKILNYIDDNLHKIVDYSIYSTLYDSVTLLKEGK